MKFSSSLSTNTRVPGSFIAFIVQILTNRKIITPNKEPPAACRRSRGDVRRELEFPAVLLWCKEKRPGNTGVGASGRQRCLLELNSYDTLKGQLLGLGISALATLPCNLLLSRENSLNRSFRSRRENLLKGWSRRKEG